jgi:hypothetical protein
MLTHRRLKGLSAMTASRLTRLTAGLLAFAALTAGCANQSPRLTLTAGSAGSFAACAEAPASAPLADVPTRGNGEPQLRVPAPAGWERATLLDSELIRYALVNKSMMANRFAPNVVVGLEVIHSDLDAEQVFAAERQGLINGGGTNLTTSDQTVCGLPAQQVDYTLPALGTIAPHPARFLVAVIHTGGKTYAASVTVQTTEPDDNGYRRDAETILRGFQVVLPATD